MQLSAIIFTTLTAASVAQAKWCACFGYDKKTGAYGPHARDICHSGGVNGTYVSGPEGQFFCDVPMASEGGAQVNEFSFKLTCGVFYSNPRAACYDEAPSN